MPTLSPNEVQLVRHLVAGGEPPKAAAPVDWTLLLDTARQHRLGTLFYLGLERRDAAVPAAIREKLEKAFHLELARAVARQHAVEQLAGMKKRLGRPLSLLKGAAFADRLYDHPAARPMADIDVLAAPADVPAFTAELAQAGFAHHSSADHATCFEHGRSGIFVELHASLTSCRDFIGIDTETLLRRSVPARRVEGLDSLSLEDHLLHLCLHASFQHGFRQPAVNAWDAGLLVEHPDFDADTFLARARTGRLGPWVYGGLALSATTFASPELGSLTRELESAAPPRLKRRLAALSPATTLSPDPDTLVRPPWRRLLWAGGISDVMTLLFEIIRPRPSARPKGWLGSLERPWQLLWNHCLRPIPLALMKHAMTLRRPTPASLGEVRDV